MLRLAQLVGPCIQQAGAALVSDIQLFCFPPAPEALKAPEGPPDQAAVLSDEDPEEEDPTGWVH